MKKEPVQVDDVHAELRAHIAKKYELQKNAADALGIDRGSLSLMLSGKRPIADVLLEDAGIKAVPQPVMYVRVERRRRSAK